MRKLLLLILVTLACAIGIQAQYVKVLGVAERSGSAVVSGISSTNKPSVTYPLSTITIYNAGTTTPASIFSTSTGVVKANPYTADSAAIYDFFIAPGASFDVRVSGISNGVTITPFTRSGYTAPGTGGISLALCGGTADTSLLAALSALGGTIEIPQSITCASNSQTLSAVLRVDNGGLLKPLTGQTVTLTAAPQIGTYQAFTNATAGLGTIAFTGTLKMPTLYPQWWGATGDCSTNDLPSITAAIAAVPQAIQGTHQNGGTVYLPSTQGCYFVGSGANGVTIDKNGFTLKSDSDVLIKYTGTGAAILIDPGFPFYITVDVGQVDSTGPYAIRLTSSTGGSNVKLRWGRLSGYKTVGMLVDGGGIGVSDVTAGETISSLSITAASHANPVVLTSAGNLLTTGDRINITGATGNWTGINGSFTVTVLTANTFTIPVDSTGFTGAMTGSPIFGAQYCVKFVDGANGSGKYEGWHLFFWAPLFNATVANFYAESGFQFNQLTADCDNTGDDVPYKLDLAGSYNTVTLTGLNPTNSAPLSSEVWLRSTAVGNVIQQPARGAFNIRYDGKQGSNAFIGIPFAPDLLKNSSFEVWNSTTIPAWQTALTNVTVAREADDTQHGTYSAKITSTDALANINQTLPSWVIGKTVTLCGWFKALSANPHSAQISMGDALNGNDNTAIPRDSSWHYMCVSHVFDPAATVPTIYVYANGSATAAGGDVVSADGLVIVQGAEPAFPIAPISAFGQFSLINLSVGSVLSISSNTIAPTQAIHHVGAGLIKTITVPSNLATGSITLIPDAAFTTDATGNIGKATTAVIGEPVIFTWDGTKWWPSPIH